MYGVSNVSVGITRVPNWFLLPICHNTGPQPTGPSQKVYYVGVYDTMMSTATIHTAIARSLVLDASMSVLSVTISAGNV